MSLPVDYYALLDIQRDASDLQIKQAYRRLALQWHPLKNKTDTPDQVNAHFTRISEAYDVLTDRQRHTPSTAAGMQRALGDTDMSDLRPGCDAYVMNS